MEGDTVWFASIELFSIIVILNPVQLDYSLIAFPNCHVQLKLVITFQSLVQMPMDTVSNERADKRQIRTILNSIFVVTRKQILLNGGNLFIIIF